MFIKLKITVSVNPVTSFGWQDVASLLVSVPFQRHQRWIRVTTAKTHKHVFRQVVQTRSSNRAVAAIKLCLCSCTVSLLQIWAAVSNQEGLLYNVYMNEVISYIDVKLLHTAPLNQQLAVGNIPLTYSYLLSTLWRQQRHALCANKKPT